MPEFIVKIIPGAQSGLAIIQQSIPVSPFLRPSVPFEKDHLHTVGFFRFLFRYPSYFRDLPSHTTSTTSQVVAPLKE